MRAYGSYGSCVVTLATSYGQLATITALRIAVLGKKQHFVTSTFSGSTVFLLVGSSSEGLYSSGVQLGGLHRRLVRPCSLNCVQTQTNHEYPLSLLLFHPV